MSKIIRKFIPLALFFWFFTLSINGHAQTSDTTINRKAEVYPNPFTSTLTIEPHKLAEDIEEMAIYDALGNLVQVFSEQDWQEEELEFDGSGLSTGPYIFFIRTKEETESIVVQKI